MLPMNTNYGPRPYEDSGIPYRDEEVRSPEMPLILSTDQYRVLHVEMKSKRKELFDLVDKKLSQPTFDDKGRMDVLLEDLKKFDNVRVFTEEAPFTFNPILKLNFLGTIPKPGTIPKG